MRGQPVIIASPPSSSSTRGEGNHSKRAHILVGSPVDPSQLDPFTFAQISPPEARPSRFVSFTQSGEIKGSRRKALNLIAAGSRCDGANP
jgi:hypothetical protein